MSVLNFRNEFDGVNISLDQESEVIDGQIVNINKFIVEIEFEDGAISEERIEKFEFDNITSAYEKFNELIKIEVEAVIGELN